MTITNDLVAFYLGMYNTGKVSLMLLFTTGVSKEVFLSAYKNFVNENILTPVEQLTTEKKIYLVAECKGTGLKFSDQTLTDAAKILHTIKFINENS